MQKDFLMKSFVMSEGERYCLLIDKHSGIPLYYPNLYLVTQIRNRSLSYSSMESSLGGVSVLLKFLTGRGQDLINRFSQYDFFEFNELDSIRDYCQIKFSARTIAQDTNKVFTLEELQWSDEKVSSKTEYVRLTVISQYLKWLAELLTSQSRNKEVTLRINKMIKGLSSRRPIRVGRNAGALDSSLDDTQLLILFEIFKPGSEENPFIEESVKVRNRLIFLMLYHLGLRGGELLNIRISDISFTQNLLAIKRRADEQEDTRKRQPCVKTRDRLLPLRETLVKEIHNYIMQYRKQTVRKGQPDYLFVTHKNGPTKGLPLSQSSYRKVIQVVSKVSPSLYKLTGHQLRHTWNQKFSELMDSMETPVPEERQEEVRSYLMGWKSGSGTATTYNKRFIVRKGHEVALKLQQGSFRLPKDLNT